MATHSNKKRGIRLMDVPHMPAEQAIILLMQKAAWVRRQWQNIVIARYHRTDNVK